MIAIVSGSNGFIGSHLVARLLRDGHEVRRLIRAPEPEGQYPGRGYLIDYGNHQSIIDSGVLEDADVLYHIAGVTKHVRTEGFRRGNVMPTENLLKALSLGRSDVFQRFVMLSSLAACGPAPSLQQPRTEEDPINPIEPYGRSKFEAEVVVQTYGIDLPFTILRPCAIYGPGDRDFHQLFSTIGRNIALFPGNRRSYTSMLYVDDLIEAIITSSTAPAAEGYTYLLSNETAVPWESIYEIIAQVSDRKPFAISIPIALMRLLGYVGNVYSYLTGALPLLNSQKVELARPKYWICSSDLARKDFGFNPQVTVEEGLKRTYAWYKKVGWL